MPDINYWLGRKYGILQQQADAGSTQANASAVASGAAATLDRTRAGLLPAESRANIAQTAAQAGLLTQQAGVVAPVARAQIGLLGAQSSEARANVGLIGANAATVNRGLQTYTVDDPAAARMQGIINGYGGFRLNPIVPGQY